jgi:predicted MFS family arabinose efflux permease
LENQTRPVSLSRLLVVVLLTRTVVNTAYRAGIPFLPLITRDLGISLQQGGLIITARNLAGFTAPVFGPLSDHIGRRAVLLVGLILFALACLLVGLTNALIFFAVGLILISVAKVLYDPAMQGLISDRVPYLTRGRIIALSELSWSLAGLVGLGLAGILVQMLNWRAPFAILGVFGIASILLVRTALPADRTARVRNDARDPQPRAGSNRAVNIWRDAWNDLRRHPHALAALAVAFLLATANEILNVVYGAWLDQSFAASAVVLGLSASVIGLAEAGGELLSSGFVDRVGKHRSVLIGGAVTALAYVVLPFSGVSIPVALVGLGFAFITFEFTLVSLLPLMTELLPASRGAMMAMNTAAFSLGRAAGSLIGPFLFSTGGYVFNAVTSGGVMIGVLLVWYFLVEEQSSPH